MSQNGKLYEPEAWLNYEAAIVHVGRSRATLKRAVSGGKIAKRTVPVPGRPPEVQLSRDDLERVFGGAPVQYTPALGSLHNPREPDEPGTALIPATSVPAALDRIADRLINTLNNWYQVTPVVGLEDKLCWTLAQARIMTGLSLPALRELVEAHPDLAIRRGRRCWVKAARLREVLG